MKEENDACIVDRGHGPCNVHAASQLRPAPAGREDDDDDDRGGAGGDARPPLCPPPISRPVNSTKLTVQNALVHS
jgi:hypothetical protein